MDIKSSIKRQYVIKYCPICKHDLTMNDSLKVEYWKLDEIVYFCWCPSCNWKGEIQEITHFLSTETEQ